MEEYFIIFKGNNKEIAILEFKTLWEVYFKEKIKIFEIENILYKFKSKFLINEDNELLKRITYTNYLGLKIVSGRDFVDLSLNLRNIDLYYLENKSFLVRNKKSKSLVKSKIIERKFAKLIWDKLKNPIVDLENPSFEFNQILYSNQKELILCKKIFENNKDYYKRMPKLRPIKMPYTLKSDMARGSVNLLKLNSGSLILDPFCGIGGILLEAYDMNFKIIGNDISWNDLKYLKYNFDYFFPNSKVIRILADSRTPFLKENSIDGIVTDIPYGKCSRRLGDNLYEEFLKQAKIYLKPNCRLVIIYANFVNFKSLALKYFEEVDEITEYINKSMTRYILILKNNK